MGSLDDSVKNMMELEMNPKRFELEMRTISKTLEMRRWHDEEEEGANPGAHESGPSLPLRIFEKMIRAKATLGTFLIW